MIGGTPNGHLHGNVSTKDGAISGNEISYIYPDMETVLFGKFEERIMKGTQESSVMKVECDENGMFYVSEMAKPNKHSPKFRYEPPNNNTFGVGPPSHADPYERKWLEVKETKETGEGVFATKDIKKGVFVASYVINIYGVGNGQFDIFHQGCTWNLTKTEDERRHCIKYSQSIKTRDAFLSLPPEYDVPDTFTHSVGPKVYSIG